MWDKLLEANRRTALDFDAEGRAKRPVLRLAVLTCMDCRIEPSDILGLEVGDAIVVRNAGGRASSDALRSLALAARLLDVERVLVLHHTDCALAGETEESVRARLEAEGVPGTAEWEFLAMPDPDTALAADVRAVRDCALMPPSIEVAGWRFDVGTGRVSSVVPLDGV